MMVYWVNFAIKDKKIGLKQDNRSLSQTVENMKIIANEKESIRKILQGKETDIEKKTREIGQLTQVNIKYYVNLMNF